MPRMSDSSSWVSLRSFRSCLIRCARRMSSLVNFRLAGRFFPSSFAREKSFICITTLAKMAVFSYRGKHKDKENKLVRANQESRDKYKGVAFCPSSPGRRRGMSAYQYRLRLRNTGGKLRSASTSMAENCHQAVVSHLLLAPVPRHRYNTDSCTYGSRTTQRRDTGQNNGPHFAVDCQRTQSSGETASAQLQQRTDCRSRRLPEQLEKPALIQREAATDSQMPRSANREVSSQNGRFAGRMLRHFQEYG
jgi:hypothetical protein